MKETGGLVGEFSLANVAPGLVFTFKVRSCWGVGCLFGLRNACRAPFYHPETALFLT